MPAGRPTRKAQGTSRLAYRVMPTATRVMTIQVARNFKMPITLSLVCGLNRPVNRPPRRVAGSPTGSGVEESVLHAEGAGVLVELGRADGGAQVQRARLDAVHHHRVDVLDLLVVVVALVPD